MAENVIQFNPKQQDVIVHECECGGQLWYILQDKRIECKKCGVRSGLPEFPEDIK